MLGSIIPSTQLHLRTLEALSLSPLVWASDDPFPKLIPQRQKRLYWAHLTLHGLYSLAMATNYLLTFREIEVTEAMLALLILGSHLVTLIIRLNIAMKEDEVLSLFKAFLLLDPEQRSQPRGQATWLIKAILHLGIVAAPISSLLISAILLAKPCMPPFIGFILLPRAPLLHSWLGYLLRGLIILFDFYAWLQITHLVSFYTFHCCLLGIACLLHHLQRADQVLQSLRSPQVRIGLHLYRQVQLAGDRFNQAYQGWVIPALILRSWFLFVPSLYSCVKLHRTMSMPGFAFFPLLLLVSLLLIFIFRVAAQVLAQSRRCQALARSNPRYGRRTELTKMARAMGLVKIKFGSTNFVDDLTPFNITSRGLDECVGFMLLT